MKFKVLFFSFLLSMLSFGLFGQKKYQTFVGGAYAVETNYGFYGVNFAVEEVMRLKPKISLAMGVNYFFSNDIPDRKVGNNLYYKGFLVDFGVKFLKNSNEKGLYFFLGPTFKHSNVRHVESYSSDFYGNPVSIKYIKSRDKKLGLKTELGISLPLSENLNSSLFIDCRILDVFFEPTFLGVGCKFGF